MQKGFLLCLLALRGKLGELITKCTKNHGEEKMQNVNIGPASWVGEELRGRRGDEYSTHEGLFLDPHFEVNFMMQGSDDDQQIG